MDTESLKVDCHAHVAPTGLLAASEAGKSWAGLSVERTATGGVQLNGRRLRFVWDAAYFEPPARRLERMGQLGIDVQILSLSGPLFGYHLSARRGLELARMVNDEVAGVVHEHPRQFGGLATLPMQTPSTAAKELARSMEVLGLKGGVVGAVVNGVDWNSSSLWPVLEVANDLGAVLLIHPNPLEIDVGPDGLSLGDLLGQTEQVSRAFAVMVFGGVIDRWPKIRFCFAQGGGSIALLAGRFDNVAAIRKLTLGSTEVPSDYLRRVYFDSLTYSYSSLELLLELAGSDRILLGTDYPSALAVADSIAWLSHAPSISAEAKAQVAGRNAMDLFGFEA